jgi:hypothetical protein
MGCGCNKSKENTIKSTTKLSETTQSITTSVSETKHQSHILSDTDPLYLQRVEICTSCEYRDPAKERCMACGCFIKAKARLTLTKCPLSEPRW